MNMCPIQSEIVGLHSGTIFVTNEQVLGDTAPRACVSTLCEDFVKRVASDLYLVIGRESMVKRKSRNPKRQMCQPAPSLAQFLCGFLKLMLQLIMGACITAAAVLLSWGCDRLADKFEGSPLSAFACKAVGVCILGAGVVSIFVFTSGMKNVMGIEPTEPTGKARYLQRNIFKPS